jgi:hypothetical protein
MLGFTIASVREERPRAIRFATLASAAVDLPSDTKPSRSLSSPWRSAPTSMPIAIAARPASSRTPAIALVA